MFITLSEHKARFRLLVLLNQQPKTPKPLIKNNVIRWSSELQHWYLLTFWTVAAKYSGDGL